MDVWLFCVKFFRAEDQGEKNASDLREKKEEKAILPSATLNPNCRVRRTQF